MNDISLKYLLTQPSKPTILAKNQPQITINYTVDIAVILNLLLCLGVMLLGFDTRSRLQKIHLMPHNVFTKVKLGDLNDDLEIERHLARMQETVVSSRVLVAIFTDGTNVPLFPFKYFSIFWEVTDTGVSSIKSKYQKIYLDRIRAELQLCMAQPNSFRKLSIQDDIDDRCKAFLLSNGINTVLSRLIGNEDEGFSGIINIQFDHDCGEITPQVRDRLNDLFLILESKITNALEAKP